MQCKAFLVALVQKSWEQLRLSLFVSGSYSWVTNTPKHSLLHYSNFWFSWCYWLSSSSAGFTWPHSDDSLQPESLRSASGCWPGRAPDHSATWPLILWEARLASHTAVSGLPAREQRRKLLGNWMPGLQNWHDIPFATSYWSKQVMNQPSFKEWRSRFHCLMGAAAKNLWPHLINHRIAVDPKSPQLCHSVSRRGWVREVVLLSWCPSEEGNWDPASCPAWERTCCF